MKIKLYMILNSCVLETINATGVYNPEKTKSELYLDCQTGYDWIMSKMTNKPTEADLPVWAFPQECAQVNIEDIKHGNCLIKASIETDRCFFTNFDGFNIILNDDPIFEDDEEWVELPEEAKIATWDKIIVNPDFTDEYWENQIAECQITFWSLKKEDIDDIIIF